MRLGRREWGKDVSVLGQRRLEDGVGSGMRGSVWFGERAVGVPMQCIQGGDMVFKLLVDTGKWEIQAEHC